MRTTLDLKDVLMREVSSRAAAEHRSLKDVVSEALALGLGRASGRLPEWNCTTHAFGAVQADYTKAWTLIDDLEADLVAEKLEKRL
jgi:hypothetical protein